MKTRQQIMLELADERSAIQITELKEEIEHLKSKFEKIQEIVAFDYELAKEVKKIIEDNNNVDKQIIIDGVNVAGCVFLNKANGFKHCYCTNEKDTLGDERNTRYGGCEYNTDCYYKQLKRLEQKNEKLKQTLEEIREKLKKYDANIGDTIIANPIQDCYDTYKLINEVLK